MARILAPDSMAADPFGEQRSMGPGLRMRLLGANFHFASDRPELLRLVAKTYDDLPSHRVSRLAPRINVRLIRTDGADRSSWRTPPRLKATAGEGLLCGAMDADNYVALCPAARAGLVAVSPRMLRWPYYARYELLEFAVYTLAARVQNLAPLHAAAIAQRGRAVLLMGDSGAGKTTTAMQCLSAGLDFISEDSTFVSADSGLTTGVANYVHLRRDMLSFLPARQARQWTRRSTTIRRRSGVEKLELDLRRIGCRLAPAAGRLVAIIFLSHRAAGNGPLLRPLRTREALARLAQLQPYAASQPSWQRFIRMARTLRLCELRRAAHPSAAVAPLRGVLTP